MHPAMIGGVPARCREKLFARCSEPVWINVCAAKDSGLLGGNVCAIYGD